MSTAFGGFISTDSNLVYSEVQTRIADPADRTFLSDAGSPSLSDQRRILGPGQAAAPGKLGKILII